VIPAPSGYRRLVSFEPTEVHMYIGGGALLLILIILLVIFLA
jgi:hypothetical protein